MVLVPANALIDVLKLNQTSRQRVAYFECLYVMANGGTRPSVELSAEAGEFPDWNDFLAFAIDAVAKAQAVAAVEQSVAIFEVGVQRG